MNTREIPQSTFLRSWLVWTAGFLALPIAGFAGTAVVGRVDSPPAALAGGAIAGLVIGAGQVLVSSRRLQTRSWIPATMIGMSAGLFLGATTVDYRTTLADLAFMGAINGVVLGSAQALVLPREITRRWIWAAAMPALWALGWTVSTLILVKVDEQLIVFGASGAVVFAALSGLLLYRLVPNPPPPEASPAHTAASGAA